MGGTVHFRKGGQREPTGFCEIAQKKHILSEKNGEDVLFAGAIPKKYGRVTS